MTLSRRVVTAAVTLALAAMIVFAGSARQAPARADTLGQLNSQLGSEQAHQQHLNSSLGSLSALISSLDTQISLVQSREAAVQQQLASDRGELARVSTSLKRERALVVKLRRRLARSRMLLSRQLVSSYEGGSPDLVTVVLNAAGFNQLLEQIAFLNRAENQQQAIITITRRDKRAADNAAARLAKLEAKDRRITAAEAVRERALAGMNELLQSRQAALQRARDAQQLALQASESRASQLKSKIAHIHAQQAAAAAAAAAQSTPPRADRARALGRLGDPILDRAVRIGRSEPAAQQRRRVGLLPDHPLDLEAVRRHRARRLSGQQGRAGRGRDADLERRRRRLELGLRGNRRDHLIRTATRRLIES